jgi:tRNA(Arg) A34 adenosine deaminase TadA
MILRPGLAQGFPMPPPMRRALDLAAQAASAGEVPVGAVVTLGEEIVA